MAELKTKATAVAVDDFVARVPDAQRRSDAAVLCALMARLTGEPATMWGPSIIGFGRYAYVSGGKPAEMCRIGFSPRAKETVVYLMSGTERHRPQLAALGKVRTGKSCLYIKSVADLDHGVLEAMIADEVAYIDARHPRVCTAERYTE